MFLLKNREFSFISHDSVLKLNDIRTISVNRILYKHSGRIDPNSGRYKEIVSLAFIKYFPDFAYDYNQKKNDIEVLSEQVKLLTETQNNLKAENEQLKAEIDSLRNLSNCN